MPILDIAPRRDESDFSNLPEVVRLFKGSRKIEKQRADGSTYQVFGKDLTHFRPEYAPGYAYIAPVFERLYGKEPTKFENVRLMAQDADSAFSYWLEEWDGAMTLVHRCDGKTQEIHYDKAQHVYDRSPIACASPACKCTKVGRLSLFLPELFAQTGVLGRVVAVTHSFHDIRAVSGYLTAIEDVLGRAGVALSDVPFTFWREERQIPVPKFEKDGKTRIGRTIAGKHLWHIKIADEYARKTVAPLLTGGTAALPESGSLVDALPAGTRWVDTERWGQFIEWASKLGYNEASAITALDAAVTYDVRQPADWNESDMMAAAAIIAHKTGYNVDGIRALGKSMKLHADYVDAALALASIEGVAE